MGKGVGPVYSPWVAGMGTLESRVMTRRMCVLSVVSFIDKGIK